MGEWKIFCCLVSLLHCVELSTTAAGAKCVINFLQDKSSLFRSIVWDSLWRVVCPDKLLGGAKTFISQRHGSVDNVFPISTYGNKSARTQKQPKVRVKMFTPTIIFLCTVCLTLGIDVQLFKHINWSVIRYHGFVSTPHSSQTMSISIVKCFHRHAFLIISVLCCTFDSFCLIFKFNDFLFCFEGCCPHCFFCLYTSCFSLLPWKASPAKCWHASLLVCVSDGRHTHWEMLLSFFRTYLTDLELAVSTVFNACCVWAPTQIIPSDTLVFFL